MDFCLTTTPVERPIKGVCCMKARFRSVGGLTGTAKGGLADVEATNGVVESAQCCKQAGHTRRSGPTSEIARGINWGL